MTAPVACAFGKVFAAFMDEVDGMLAMSDEEVARFIYIAGKLMDARYRLPLSLPRLRLAMKGRPGEEKVAAFCRSCPFIYCYEVGGKEYATIPSFAHLARHPSIGYHSFESLFPAPSANDHMDEALSEAIARCELPGSWWQEPVPKSRVRSDDGPDGDGEVSPSSGSRKRERRSVQTENPVSLSKVTPATGSHSQKSHPDHGVTSQSDTREAVTLSPPARVQGRAPAHAPLRAPGPAEQNRTEQNRTLSPLQGERECMHEGPGDAPGSPPLGSGGAGAGGLGEVGSAIAESAEQRAERKAREKQARLADARAKFAQIEAAESAATVAP